MSSYLAVLALHVIPRGAELDIQLPSLLSPCSLLLQLLVVCTRTSDILFASIPLPGVVHNVDLQSCSHGSGHTDSNVSLFIVKHERVSPPRGRTATEVDVNLLILQHICK